MVVTLLRDRSAAPARTCRVLIGAALLATAAFADCAFNAGCGKPALAAAEQTGATQTPLQALQAYMDTRGLDPNTLGATQMVDVMLDWYRSAPLAAAGADELIFRYGGWSEGCVTAFKFSLLRRIGPAGDGVDQFAGITLMFEPSAQSELDPFSAQSSEAGSLTAFAEAVKSSPAYRKLSAATPLAVVVEVGGVR